MTTITIQLKKWGDDPTAIRPKHTLHRIPKLLLNPTVGYEGGAPTISSLSRPVNTCPASVSAAEGLSSDTLQQAKMREGLSSDTLSRIFHVHVQRTTSRYAYESAHQRSR